MLIHEQDIRKTAFRMHWGLYEFLVIPSGSPIGVIHQRECVLGVVVAERVGDLMWLTEIRGSRLGRFIRSVMDIVESTQEVHEVE